MSTELNTIPANSKTKEIYLTSYSGGKEHGPCIQLSQQSESRYEYGVIHMTREQVEQAIATMQVWLNERA